MFYLYHCHTVKLIEIFKLWFTVKTCRRYFDRKNGTFWYVLQNQTRVYNYHLSVIILVIHLDWKCQSMLPLWSESNFLEITIFIYKFFINYLNDSQLEINLTKLKFQNQILDHVFFRSLESKPILGSVWMNNLEHRQGSALYNGKSA